MTAKKKLGISTCLLGGCVRYDGSHKHDRALIEALGKDFEFVPVCPETDCGMTILREPLCIAGNPEYLRIVTVRTNIDHSDRMRSWGLKRLEEIEREELCGYIFKSKSPSCGLRDIGITDSAGNVHKSGTGFWAVMFTCHFPNVPVENENRLQNPIIREQFIIILDKYRIL